MEAWQPKMYPRKLNVKINTDLFCKFHPTIITPTLKCDNSKLQFTESVKITFPKILKNNSLKKKKQEYEIAHEKCVIKRIDQFCTPVDL